MTREELDFIGSMNMCDEISNEAYKKIVCHCEGQEPCPNTVSRSDMLDAIGHSMSYTSEDLQKIIKALPPVNPQPYEDAISREDALMALTGEWTEITDEIIHRFIKRIKALPPVNPQPKWIPVSKRLPELNKPLLVTTYHRVYYGHLISESDNYGYPVFRIHGLGDKNRDWVQETMSHEPYSLRRIDAWMYLDIPEPYKVSEIPTGSDPQESEKVN